MVEKGPYVLKGKESGPFSFLLSFHAKGNSLIAGNEECSNLGSLLFLRAPRPWLHKGEHPWELFPLLYCRGKGCPFLAFGGLNIHSL